MFYEDEEEKRRQTTAQYVDTPYGLVRNSEPGQKTTSDMYDESQDISSLNTNSNNTWKIRPEKADSFKNGIAAYVNNVTKSMTQIPVLGQAIGAAKDLGENYIKMVNANLVSSDEDKLQNKTVDNYYHCKGNYNASNRGSIGNFTAEVIGNLREIGDIGKNINKKSYQETLDDYHHDMDINRYSRNLGRQGNYNSAEEACRQFKPAALDEEEKQRKWGYPIYGYRR